MEGLTEIATGMSHGSHSRGCDSNLYALSCCARHLVPIYCICSATVITSFQVLNLWVILLGDVKNWSGIMYAITWNSFAPGQLALESCSYLV